MKHRTTRLAPGFYHYRGYEIVDTHHDGGNCWLIGRLGADGYPVSAYDPHPDSAATLRNAKAEIDGTLDDNCEYIG